MGQTTFLPTLYRLIEELLLKLLMLDFVLFKVLLQVQVNICLCAPIDYLVHRLEFFHVVLDRDCLHMYIAVVILLSGSE